MRHLRLLGAIGMIATMFVVAAGPVAATDPVIPGIPGIPTIPTIPGLGGLDGQNGLPLFVQNIPCTPPTQLNGASPSGQLQNGTIESWVLLWPPSSSFGSIFGNMERFDIKKCLFHFNEPVAPTNGSHMNGFTLKDFPCTYQAPWGLHVFAHSIYIERHNFAMLVCTGAGTLQKLNQTITFTSTPPQTIFPNETTYSVTATATSGLPVTFTIDPSSAGACTITGNVVSFPGPTGTCTIDANQAGDAIWNAAPQVQQPFTVNPTT